MGRKVVIDGGDQRNIERKPEAFRAAGRSALISSR
jgi:hypothetical protein